MTATGHDLAQIGNGAAVPWTSVPDLALQDLQHEVAVALDDGLRLCALFALKRASDATPRLLAVLGDGREGRLLLGTAIVGSAAYPSLSPRVTQASRFEREIYEQFGLRPEGHPDPKPLRFQRPFGVDPRSTSAPVVGQMDFYRIEGDGVHEVAVGPVHAGVIEPGHFRFQCDGEHVFHLEVSLGYQHRGVEAALLGGPGPQARHQIETSAGDTTIGHALAYAQNLEALAGLRVSAHAHVVRAIALELERLANHTGDLGALAGDVGFLPTASFCGRLRGDFLNMTALVCGSRFGRGLVNPGGVRFGVDVAMALELTQGLVVARRELTAAVELLWSTPSVLARFEGVGTVSSEVAVQLGLVGPAARACGMELDVRMDHPTGAYRFVQLPLATAQAGDVHARAFVRWLEIQRSMAFVIDLLAMVPRAAAPAIPRATALMPDHLAVSLVEGWRGEICHVASTDRHGRFDRYKIVDPSFHNWSGLEVALRGQEISDFPLCNKSFDLSYCGHDL